MPPLPPNVTKAGLLRSKSGWNNSSLSRRSGTTVGLLSTRTPHSSGNSGGGIPNPSLGIGVIREAMPRNAAGTWTPVSLSDAGPIWIVKTLLNSNAVTFTYTSDPFGQWSQTTLPHTGTTAFASGYSLEYGEGKWIFVHDGDIVAISSPSGPIQTLQAGATTSNPDEIEYGSDGNWMIAAPDPLTATTYSGPWVASGATGNSGFIGLSYGNGYWVVGQGSGGTATNLLVSASPTGPWTTVQLSNSSLGNAQAIAYGGGNWVAILGTGEIFVADDPNNPAGTWTQGATDLNLSVYDVAYGDGEWLCATSGGIYIADVGSNPLGTWSLVTGVPNVTSFTIRYYGGVWMAGPISSQNPVYAARDPRTSWTLVVNTGTAAIRGIGYGVPT